MSEIMKKRLADALDVLLKEKSIVQIKVSDIVKCSGVSRQTFYNNFCDIYELLYWSHSSRNAIFIEKFWEEEDFRKTFLETMQMMQERKAFYQQVIRKEGQNSFQQTFIQSMMALSAKRIHIVSGQKPTEKEKFFLEMYWIGAGQMLVKWIVDGMKEEPEEMAQRFYDALPLPLRKFWLK